MKYILRYDYASKARDPFGGVETSIQTASRATAEPVAFLRAIGELVNAPRVKGYRYRLTAHYVDSDTEDGEKDVCVALELVTQ